MPKILSYNSPPNIEKKIGKDNLLKVPWNWFSSQDRFTKYSIITLLLIVVATPFIVNNYLETRQKAAPVQNGNVYTDSELSKLGMHKLAPDEFAVIKTLRGNPTGKIQKGSIKLASGAVYDFEADTNTRTTVLEGGELKVNYVQDSPSITIHNLDELDNTSGKVDTGVTRKLKNQTVVPVILQFNLPFDKFYQKGDDQGKITDKLNKFNDVKTKVASLIRGNGKLKQDLRIINGGSADVDQATLDSLIESPLVKKIELDRTVHAFLDTSVDEINARNTWTLFDSSNNALTGIGKKIAVIDTGVDYTHPDLGGCFGPNCKVIGGYDCYNNDSDPMDDHGHGTHVAATSAGKGWAANGQQLWGVAPDAKILAFKVLSSQGSGSDTNVLCGINRSVDPNNDGSSADHADVGTMSLGGTGNPDDSLSLAVDNGTAAGVVFTIAAGNSGPTLSTIGSPGTARTAITVAAACKTGQGNTTSPVYSSYCTSGPIASFSSRGPLVWNGVDIQKPDVAAPGVLICATRWDGAFSSAPTCFDNSHIRISGTSMATPHVAGSAALVLQAFPNYTPSQVKQVLKSTAKNLGATYNDEGAGEISLSAAIPLSNKLGSSPQIWNVNNDPTQKLNSISQSFSVTPLGSMTGTASISSQLNVPGVNISFSATSLNLSTMPASFSATINIDNDQIKSGTYNGSIVFSQNGTSIAIIPIYITIKPSISVSPQGVIDYGVDDPSLSNWTSTTQTLTLTNLRTDISQTVSLSSNYGTGITLNAPSSVTVPAGGTTSVNTGISVNNTSVANGIYTGFLNLTNSINNINVNTKFTKYYVLTITDANSAEFVNAQVWVYDGYTTVTDLAAQSPLTFYLNKQGTYDVIISFVGTCDGTGCHDYTVFKEKVSVLSGTTNVNVSRSDANLTVNTIPTDHNGNRAYPITQRGTALNASGFLTIGVEGAGGDMSLDYFSPVSSNYHVSFFRSWPVNGNSQTVDLFYNYFQGLQSNIALANSATDLKRQDVRIDINQQTGNITPKLWQCILPFSHRECFTFYSTAGTALSAPSAVQTIYSEIVQGQGYVDLDMPQDISPHFVPGTANRALDLNMQQLIPPIIDNKLYTGLGPSYWAGKFANSSITLKILPYFSNTNNPLFAFLRQDYSIKDYPSSTLGLSQNGTQVAAIPISSFTSHTGYSYYNPTVLTYTLPQAGKYQVSLNMPYVDKGQTVSGTLTASFDTTLSDPNPPSIKRLYFYTNCVRSEIYDSSATNRLDFELDPVGGTLGTVTVGYALDGGTSFNSVATNLNNGVYSATLPVVSISGKIDVQVSASDSSSNTMSYAFELPKGTASAPSSTCTATPTPTPLPSPSPTSIPTPTVVPITQPAGIDKTPPTVSITAPVNGAIVARNFTITIQAGASDNVAVAHVDFLVNGSLICSDTTTPYSCSWKTSGKPNATYTLTAKAYDTSGNTASVSITVKSTSTK